MQILTEGHEVKTGFILNDHKLQSKYKTGMKLKCRVLDVDFDKKIADLKEISDKQTEEGSKTFKPDQKVKVIVEINKEGYLVVSLKSQRQTLGLCFYQNFNQDAEKPEFEVGQEIEAIVRAQNEKNGFYELFLAPKEAEKTRTAGGSTPTIELKAGIKFSGQIRSIKG
jgi:ribosomal protein S1